VTAVFSRPARPKPLRGELVLPGDKSISHRALMLAALARGTSRLRRLAPGRDVRSTAACLRRLGVTITARGPGETFVYGRAGTGGCSPALFREPGDVLDCGNSATTMRLLLGILAGQRLFAVLTGDRSLRRRPMRRVTEPLSGMGARFAGRMGASLAPLAVCGADLKPGVHRTGVASAQVKSALLLAGLFARGRTSVAEPVRSRDHTERLLAAMGTCLCRVSAVETWIEGPATLAPLDLTVPGDPSSAAFLAAAALLVPKSSVVFRGVSLNPTRLGFFRVLREAGAVIEIRACGEAAGEPFGDIAVEHSGFGPLNIGPAEVPELLDEIPLLALLATQAAGKTAIRGAAELRLKECDRLAATAAGLRAVGAAVEDHPDGLEIEGPAGLHAPAQPLDSRGDHRMAMTWAVASLVLPGEVRVTGDRFARVSYPGFAADLGSLTGDRK